MTTESRSRALIASITRTAVRSPWLVLLAGLIVTGLSIAAITRLDIRSNFEELLPEDVPSVAHIKQMIARVGGDGSVLVLVESINGRDGVLAAKKLVPVLAEEL